MNKKGVYAFRIVLGGYLAYLGISILIQMYNERPTNMVVMCAAGAAFLVIGGGYAAFSLKKVLDIRKEERGAGAEVQEPEERSESTLSKTLPLRPVGSAEQPQAGVREENTAADSQEPGIAAAEGLEQADQAHTAETAKAQGIGDAPDVQNAQDSQKNQSSADVQDVEDMRADDEDDESSAEEEIENDYEEK